MTPNRVEITPNTFGPLYEQACAPWIKDILPVTADVSTMDYNPEALPVNAEQFTTLKEMIFRG